MDYIFCGYCLEIGEVFVALSIFLFCIGTLAWVLYYFRRKALRTKSNKNNLIIKEKKSCQL